MPKCEQCGKDFKNELALKIHVGRQHKKAKKAAAKAAAPAKAGGNRCGVCGRVFNLPAHLARHMSASHGRGRKAGRPGRPAGRKPRGRVAAVRSPAAEAAIAPSVRALTVDQLLILKRQIDARLADIARQMRAAKVSL